MLKRTKIIVGALLAIVVLVVVVVAVYLLTRDDAPEAVDLETTVARIEAAETADDDTPSATEPADADTRDTPSTGTSADDAEDTGTTSSAGSEDTTATGSGEAAADGDTADAGTGDSDTESSTEDQTVDAPAGLAGVWSVQVAEDAGDLQGEPTVSFAGFRVDEVLSSIGEFTAVGRTADVSGSIELTDTALVAATVQVSMSTLRTDNGSRDSQVRRALNTNGFPMAVFTLAEPVELPAGMADGEAFSGPAEGDLTIKGVTNRVTFDLQAQLVGDIIVAVGSSDVVLSDYGVTAPTAPIVVSVEDHGIMEFQLIFTR